MAAKTSWHRYETKLHRSHHLYRVYPPLTDWWGTGMVICLERGADKHTAQLMPLPLTVSCSSKIQIGFTFRVPAYPGCPGKEAVKWL